MCVLYMLIIIILMTLYFNTGLYVIHWCFRFLVAHMVLFLEVLLSSRDGHILCFLVNLFVSVWMETCGLIPTHVKVSPLGKLVALITSVLSSH